MSSSEEWTREDNEWCEQFMKEVYADPIVMAAEVPTEKMWNNIMSKIRAQKLQKEGVK